MKCVKNLYFAGVYTHEYNQIYLFLDEELIIEFLDDIISNKPVMMVDTSADDYPIFSFPIQSIEIDQKIQNINVMYDQTDQLGSWKVYELLPD